MLSDEQTWNRDPSLPLSSAGDTSATYTEHTTDVSPTPMPNKSRATAISQILGRTAVIIENRAVMIDITIADFLRPIASFIIPPVRDPMAAPKMINIKDLLC